MGEKIAFAPFASEIWYTIRVKSLGYSRLIDEFDLSVCALLVQCHLTERSVMSVSSEDGVEHRIYPVGRLTLEDTWQGHLLFAVKNEGVNLEVLKALFKKITASSIELLVRQHPTGAVHRRIWFLYEYLTDAKLALDDADQGGYVPLVDEDLQLACPKNLAVRVRRMRIINNLVGDRAFSPLVRKTPLVRKYPAAKLKALSDSLLAKYPVSLQERATHYLYVKETKSSFALERETPSQRRTNAFVEALRSTGTAPLTKETLLDVQNRVVDSRYAQRDWRTSQVYVGETVTPGHEKIHFVAVRPQDVADVMSGFLRTLDRLLVSDVDAVLFAAVMSFAFVFIHPFDDGNGRVHRYLMHAILSRLKFSPAGGIVFPISAALLKKRATYDRMLESFSRRLMQRLEYDVSADGEVSVLGESADFYRFIDFTPIVEDFQRLIVETIRTEWRFELDYLADYDRMRREMREIVDLPEKKANQFILFVKNNHGRLSVAKRPFFAELTDAEVARLERIVNAKSS